jgi:RNA polymerase sigma-70 factor (ECF subfamily)
MHGIVVRWVARILTLPRFRLARPEWPDLHQDVLRKLIESLRRGRFESGQDFRVYVQAIARYTAQEAVKRRIRSLRTESGRPVANVVDAVARTEGKDLDSRRMKEILAELSEGCRSVFHLVYYQELTYEEAAARLGLPVGTLKSRLARCLERARELLLAGTQE